MITFIGYQTDVIFFLKCGNELFQIVIKGAMDKRQPGWLFELLQCFWGW